MTAHTQQIAKTPKSISIDELPLPGDMIVEHTRGVMGGPLWYNKPFAFIIAIRLFNDELYEDSVIKVSYYSLKYGWYQEQTDLVKNIFHNNDLDRKYTIVRNL